MTRLKELDIEPQILKGVPYNDAAVKVVDCLEGGLNLRKTKNSTLPYLETNGDSQPLQLYLELGNAIHAAHPPLKPNDSLPMWGLLAKAYLKVALEAFKEEQQFYEILNHFMPEIEERIQENKTNYTWFSLFIDRLSIVMTKPKDRDNALGFNTGFDTYKEALITYQSRRCPPLWCSHQGYKETCQQVGSDYTKNVLSPLALSKELFPDIVMSPYPYKE